MKKNVIYATTAIPKDAQILLVGVSGDSLEGTDYDWNSDVFGKVDDRIDNMIETVNALEQKGHTVLLNADEVNYIFEPLRHFTVTPNWGIYNLPVWEDEVDPAKVYHLNPEFAAAFDKEKVILVGGLWRELYPLSIVRLLTYHGYKAVLSLNDDLSLPVNLTYIDDNGISLKGNAAKANLTIESYEGE